MLQRLIRCPFPQHDTVGAADGDVESAISAEYPPNNISTGCGDNWNSDGQIESRETSTLNTGIESVTEIGEIKMNFLAILNEIMGIAAAAQQFIPILAVAHTAQDPTSSNNALSNASQVITAAQGIVAAGETAAAAAVANGATAPTGVQKLAIAQAAVQQAHTIAVASGHTNSTFEAIWTPLNAAITAICSAMKPSTTPTTPAA